MSISAAISGNHKIIKAGAGLLNFSGANTYTGSTTINAGTLQFAKEVSLYNNNTASWTAANLIVASGATAAFNVGGTGEFTSSDIDTLKALGTASGGFESGSVLGLDTTNASGGTFTYSSNIANPNSGANVLGLTKLGTGTLVLSGTNSYTGATTVSAGVLNIQSATALGSTASGTTVLTGATLQLQNNITVGAEALTINGTGASGQNGALVNVSGTNNYGGLLTLGSASTISSDSGTLNLTNSGTITGSGFDLTLTGSGNGNITSIIGTGSGALIKSGSGTWTLNSANTYTGLTTITAGTLTEGVSNAISTGGLTVNGATAVFDLGANHSDSVGTVTLDGGGSITGTGTSTLTSTGTFEMKSGSASATLAGSGIALNKTTSGTVTLTGINTYTGLTTITAGTLAEGVSNAISTGGVTVNGATAVFDLGANHSDSVGIVTLDGGGSITGTGTSTLTSTGSFEMKNGSASAILDGSGIALNKTTSGTVTLTGANTYTGGTNVSGGALLANNASGSATGTGSVTVTGAGTLLGGNGTITGAVSMANGTILSPGATTASGTTAILKTGALTLSSGSNFNVDLNGTTAGSSYDQLQVTGTVNITGSNLVVNPAAGLTIGNKFFILLNDASDSISGQFAQGATVTAGSDTFAINYLDNGDGGSAAGQRHFTDVDLRHTRARDVGGRGAGPGSSRLEPAPAAFSKSENGNGTRRLNCASSAAGAHSLAAIARSRRCRVIHRTNTDLSCHLRTS